MDDATFKPRAIVRVDLDYESRPSEPEQDLRPGAGNIVAVGTSVDT